MGNESEIYLSIVIPAFNEAKRLPPSLRDIISFFSKFPAPYEVLVIVEKSTDNTVQLAEAAVQGHPQFKIIDNQVKKGKGYAVRSGMLKARGQFQFFMDADLSTPLAEVVHFLGLFESHPDVDVFIGSRKHPETQILKKQNPLRQKMGETFNKLVMGMALKGFRDTQCGFKAFRRKASQEIFPRATLNGFSFDVELLLLAMAMGFKVREVPIKWVNSPESKVHIVKDSLHMLWDIMKVKRLVHRSLSAKPFHPSSEK
jgi:dolichyl-phosphate beta-glucosyltransferase